MNKTKFWKAAKVALLTLFVSLFTLGMVSLNDAEDVTAETAGTATMTVEDLYDVTDGQKVSFLGQSGAGNFQGYQSSVDKNYEFSAHMSLTFEKNKEFVAGIMANKTGGWDNNDGYWFVLNENADTTLRTIKLLTERKTYVGGKVWGPVMLSNTNGELNAVWSKLLDSDGFDFSFGVQEKVDDENVAYTYVYVKIDGEILVDYDNYYNYRNTDVTYGKYIFADAANRVNIYANKTEVEMTYEDIYDVSGAPIFDGINGKQNGLGSETNILGKSSVNINYEFNAHVYYDNTRPDFPIAILSNGKHYNGSMSYNTACDGYWFHHKKDATLGNIVVLSLGRPNNAANIVRTATAPTEMYSADGYDFTFGVKEIKRGNTVISHYIYVKINGETFFDYFNLKFADRDLGNYLLSDTLYRATFTVPSANDIGVDMLGASIKISNTGIRFATEIDTATYNGLIEKYGVDNVTLGTIVLPTVLLQGKELTLQTAQIQNSINEVWFAENEDTKEWTCVVKNVPEGAYNIKISARSYLQITTNGKTYTFYAQTIERSIADVAQAALKDYVLTTDVKYDAEIYKHEYVVGGTTYYHRYSETDRTNLQKYVEGV